jgi:hypothetical protein
MKYIKKFNEGKKSIKDWCENLNIQKYTINSNGTVDVDYWVDIRQKDLDILPIKFGIITGEFNCQDNKLVTLKGCPRKIGGDFHCGWNQLTTLKYGPQYIRSYYCNTNKLISLEGSPEKLNGSFYCVSNKLTSLNGCPKEIHGWFECDNNKLTSLEGGPEVVGSRYRCNNNELNTLKGSPKKIEIEFNCSYNNLETLEGGPEIVNGKYDCRQNELYTLKGLAKNSPELKCAGNPVNFVYMLFDEHEDFMTTLDFNYLRKGNKIYTKRFKKALDEIGMVMPEYIKRYEFI